MKRTSLIGFGGLKQPENSLCVSCTSRSQALFLARYHTTRAQDRTMGFESIDHLSQNSVKPFHLMPSPWEHWSIRLARLLLGKGGIGKTIYKMQEDVIKKYGPIVRVIGPQGPEVWTVNPDDVATLHRVESKHPQRIELPALQFYYKSRKKAPGVFFADGSKWYRLRSALSPRLLVPLEIGRYIPRLNDISNELITRIEEGREGQHTEKADEVTDLNHLLFYWAFECVTDILFDKRFGALGPRITGEVKEFLNAVEDFLRYFFPVFVWPHFVHQIYKSETYKRFDKAYLTMYHYADIFIEDRLMELAKQGEGGSYDDGQSQSFIGHLVSSKHLQPDEVSDSIIDTLFAGIDTTSKTMQWILYLLAKNPKTQDLLVREICESVSKHSCLDSTTLGNMPYLSATIKETLRLYPVLVTLNRVITKDVVLSGYSVPAGTPVIVLSHALSRRQEVFEDPLEFRPERWLRHGNELNVHAFGSTPFGHGRRMCLGRRIATMELKLLLIKLLRRYRLDYPPGKVLGQYLRGTNIPDGPVRVKFLPRI